MSGRLEPEPLPRRDFLGLAAIWASIAAFVTAAVGALRLPMPSVFPESNSKVKIGHPEKFPAGSVTGLPELRSWIHHDENGLYAISSICTHLGCIAGREKTGVFKCPCHGSVFSSEGKVVEGPAPKRLTRLELTLAPDGQIVVDTSSSVESGQRLKV